MGARSYLHLNPRQGLGKCLENNYQIMSLKFECSSFSRTSIRCSACELKAEECERWIQVERGRSTLMLVRAYTELGVLGSRE